MLNFLKVVWSYIPAADQKWLLRCMHTLIVFLLIWLVTGKRPDIPIPLPPEDIHYPHIDGWKNDPKAVQDALAIIEENQGIKPVFAIAGKELIEAPDDNAPVFFWDAERQVAGSVLTSWNQGQVGCCVSFGWGRSVQDLIFLQASTGKEKWNGKLVATEPLYGCMRVQVGGGRMGNSDGATGAWAAVAVQQDKGGILFRQEYPPNWDFSTYSESMARKLGVQGLPRELVPIAQQHPVQTVALVKSASEAWTAIGNGYPIPICSNVGFQSPQQEGFCSPSGQWNHCMCIRARFIHPSRGKCFVIQNSWGDYLKADGTKNVIQVRNSDGSTQQVTLPQGCFATTEQVINRILSQGDSYAISSFKGFPQKKWLIRNQNVDKMYAMSH